MNEWIKCSVELPDSDQTVLVFHKEEDPDVWIGYHDGKHWRCAEGPRCAASHWMPLPEPPTA